MLHTKFQASKPSGSEEEDFFYYFSMFFYGLNLGSPAKEPSWILGPHLNKICQNTTWQCYIPNFKHLSQVVLK